jgi:hypothetical protein
MRIVRSLVGLVASLVPVACGGGSAPPTLVTIVLLSTPALDGTVGRNGSFGTTGPVVQAGDSTTNLGLRGFVSFDLGSIPPGATVIAATLRLTQERVTGNPYGDFGPVVLDQVLYGSVLESGAFDRSFPVNQQFATLSSDSALGEKTVDATAPVQHSLASGHAESQYRLRFPIESDGQADFDLADFNSGDVENTPDVRPTLTVTYVP